MLKGRIFVCWFSAVLKGRILSAVLLQCCRAGFLSAVLLQCCRAEFCLLVFCSAAGQDFCLLVFCSAAGHDFVCWFSAVLQGRILSAVLLRGCSAGIFSDYYGGKLNIAWCRFEGNSVRLRE